MTIIITIYPWAEISISICYNKRNSHSCMSLLSLAHTCVANVRTTVTQIQMQTLVSTKGMGKKSFSYACVCVCVRFHTCEPGQRKRKCKCKTQVISVPCHLGTVQNEMTSTSPAISEEKLRRVLGNFLFLSTTVSRNLNNSKWSLLGKMRTREVGLKDIVFYKRM